MGVGKGGGGGGAEGILLPQTAIIIIPLSLFMHILPTLLTLPNQITCGTFSDTLRLWKLSFTLDLPMRDSPDRGQPLYCELSLFLTLL